MPTSNHQPQPTVDRFPGPKHIQPPRHDEVDLQPHPDPDAENFAEVGDNVQKSMDQALEFQNQESPTAPHSVSSPKKASQAAYDSCPLLLTYHH